MNSHQKADAVVAMMSSSLMSNLSVIAATAHVRELALKAHAFDVLCRDMETNRKHLGNRRLQVGDTSNFSGPSTAYVEVRYRDIPMYEWTFYSEGEGSVIDRLIALGKRKDVPNQCDGCCVKAPINKNGNHIYPDGSLIGCTKKRYT